MEPLTKKQGMMKKLFVICSWALLLGGCKSESGASDPDGDKPVPPPSAELLQKIEDLNAGLVSLKTLAGAVSQSEVRSLAETEDGWLHVFLPRDDLDGSLNQPGIYGYLRREDVALWLGPDAYFP